MDAYTGKYFVNGGGKQDATILLQHNRISIGLTDSQGAARSVYWPLGELTRDRFHKGRRTQVSYGSYPVQTIEVESGEFEEKLEAIFRNREKSWFSKTVTRNRVHMFKVLTIFFAFLAAAYFLLVPFLAERLAKRVPVSYEEKLGNGLFETLKQGFEVEELKTALINDFFYELKIPSDYDVRITVVRSDMANAFTLPGGRIIVYDQILAGMDHYEELAALLSHEFSHIADKHTTRSLFRQMGSGILFSVLIGDVGAIGNLIINNAHKLKVLSYSRKLEKEADLNGLKLLSERKIDCNGYVGLFRFLDRELSGSVDQPAEWVSSHPDLEKRIGYIRKNEWFNSNGVEENEKLKSIFIRLKAAD